MKTLTKTIMKISVGLLMGLSVAQAQYVNIPDANFRSWIQTNYPLAINSLDQMDTTNLSIINAISIDVSGKNISNLDGIQYFDKLEFLYCSGNYIQEFPSRLPNGLYYLIASNNKLISLPQLPPLLEILDVKENFISSLPQLPSSLISLDVKDNQLTGLPEIPATVTDLDASRNFICNFASNLPAGAITTQNFCVDFSYQNSCGEKTASFMAINEPIGASSYTWDFGDITSGSNTSTENSPSHIFNSDKEYNVKLTYTTLSKRGVEETVTKTTSVSKKLIIASIPSVNLGSDVITCENSQPLTLRAGKGFASYQWQDGSTDSLLVVTKSGKYTVTVTNAKGCIATDEVIVTVNQAAKIQAPSSVDLCTSNTTLDAGEGFESYQWQDGSTKQTLVVSKPGIYSVTGTTKQGCSVSKQIAVNFCPEFSKLSEKLKVPNVFTPNGDGRNEYFEIKELVNYPENKLQIYSRWGDLVYEAANYANTWNGSNLTPGTYFYQLTVYAGGQSPQTITGWVQSLGEK